MPRVIGGLQMDRKKLKSGTVGSYLLFHLFSLDLCCLKVKGKKGKISFTLLLKLFTA